MSETVPLFPKYKGILGVDWSTKSGLALSDNGLPGVYIDENFKELINLCEPGTKIVTECSIESYSGVKQTLLDYANIKNVEIILVNPRLTAKLRRKKYVKKSDENDAVMLYYLYFTAPSNKRRIPKFPKKMFDSEQNRTRRQFYFDKTLTRDVPKMPNFYDVTELERWLCYDDKGKPRVSICEVLLEIISKTRSNNEFDTLIGSYGNGYPSYYRSTLYNYAFDTFAHHYPEYERYRELDKRRGKIIQKINEDEIIEESERLTMEEDKELDNINTKVLRDFQRALRKMRSRLRYSELFNDQ